MDINGSLQVSGQINASDIKKEIGVKTNNCKWFVLFTPISLLIFTVLIFLYSFNANPILIFKIFFIISALINSVIYGYYAYEIHGLHKGDSDFKRYNQYWLNGLGAFLGWIALYILIFHRVGHIVAGRHSFDFSSWVTSFGWEDFILILFSYVGVTGYLPHAIVQGKIPGK